MNFEPVVSNVKRTPQWGGEFGNQRKAFSVLTVKITFLPEAILYFCMSKMAVYIFS
jgi:hypothetical protein